MSRRRSPSISRQASLASGCPVAFETKGTVREARGLASITYSSSSPKTANWMLMRPITPSRSAIASVARSTCSSMLGPRDMVGDHAGGVAGVHPGLLHVLHHGPDAHLVAVAQGVHVDLDRVLEEAVEEDLAVRGERGPHPPHVVLERVRRVTDLHGPAAEHVGRTHQQRVAHLLRRLQHRVVAGGGVRRAAQPELVEQRAEARPVLGQVDRVHRRPEQRYPGVGQPTGQLQRRLASELDDHALRALQLQHPEHVPERQGLEVQPVGRVVVGGDRLRVAVDHHRVPARTRARSWPRARSSSRTRCPVRCGSARSRGWPPRACLRAGPRGSPCAPSRSSSRASRPRTRPRRCPPP